MGFQQLREGTDLGKHRLEVAFPRIGAFAFHHYESVTDLAHVHEDFVKGIRGHYAESRMDQSFARYLQGFFILQEDQYKDEFLA